MKAVLKKVAFLLLICIPMAGMAQATAEEGEEIAVGDTLVFGACTEKGYYQYVDRYVRTRISPSPKPWNKKTGDGFYEYFFEGGDFDVARMKCEYSGKMGIIVSIRTFQDKNTNKLKTVVFCLLENENTVAWIEIEPAAAAREVFLQ